MSEQKPPISADPEIESLVLEHIETITFAADLEHISSVSDQQLAKNIELETKKQKALEKLNLSLVNDVASIGLNKSSRWSWKGVFEGAFDNPAAWMMHPKHVTYIRPAANEKTVYDLTIDEKWLRARKERRAIPAMILAQSAVIVEGQISGFNTLALVDSSCGMLFVYESGNAKYPDFVESVKRPGVDKKPGRLCNTNEHHIVHFFTPSKIEKVIDLPDPEEITASYDPQTKTFTYTSDVSLEYADSYPASKLFRVATIPDVFLQSTDTLQNATSFASCASHDVEKDIDYLLDSYQKNRNYILKKTDDKNL